MMSQAEYRLRGIGHCGSPIRRQPHVGPKLDRARRVLLQLSNIIRGAWGSRDTVYAEQPLSRGVALSPLLAGIVRSACAAANEHSGHLMTCTATLYVYEPGHQPFEKCAPWCQTAQCLLDRIYLVIRNSHPATGIAAYPSVIETGNVEALFRIRFETKDDISVYLCFVSSLSDITS